MIDISIIIPVYNAEKYLSICLNSILKQTFKNFEVILINDGSTDNSQLICERYVDIDNRIRLFSIPNNGVSHARNYALDKSVGEWVTFVDSDDWVEVDYLESLFSHTKVGVDVVMGNFFFNKEHKETIGRCSTEIISRRNLSSYPLAMMVEDCAQKDNIGISVEILCAACGKLTRRELILNNHVKFKENMKLNEDCLFHLTTYLKADDFIVIDKPLYHYRLHADSSNYRFRPDVEEQMRIWHKNFGELANMLSDNQKKSFMSLCAYRMYLNIFSLFLNYKESKLNFYQKRAYLKKIISTGLYEIYKIDKELMAIKKMEMFLLQKHYYSALLMLSNIKNYIKKLLK